MTTLLVWIGTLYTSGFCMDHIPVAASAHLFDVAVSLIVVFLMSHLTSETSGSRGEERSTRLNDSALLRSQTLLAEVEALSHIGAWEWDLREDRWTFSDEWRKIHGVHDRLTLTPEELLEIAHPEDMARIHDAIENAGNGRSPYDIEHRIIRQDTGDVRIVRASGRYVCNAANTVTRVYGFVQDITEQRQVEEQNRRQMEELASLTEKLRKQNEEHLRRGDTLRMNEERFRQLADAMPQLVWTANPDGTVDYYNNRVLEFRGFSKKSTGEWGWELVLHPDDVQSTIHAWLQAVQTGETYVIEHRVQGSDGSFRWYLSRGIPARDDAGTIVKWFGTATDIHDLRSAQEELRRSEEQLSTIIGSAMDGVISIDEQQRIVLFNMAAEKMFGTDGDRAIGQRLDRFIPGRFREAHRTHIDTFGKTHVTRRSMGALGSIFGVRENGEEFPIEASISQVEINGRKLFTVILRDIAERVQAERQIMASLREKEVLLKEVHHRVKNNLQLISSMLRLQSELAIDAPALEVLRETQARIRAMALVHEKLYQAETLSTVDFGEYLTSLSVNLFRSLNASSGEIELSLDVDHLTLGVDTAIPCGLIVNELLTNALKYAFPETGPGEIGVAFHRADPGGEYILAVYDTGKGIPMPVDFQKATSLGLQLVHTLVEELGGTMDVASGRGTRFTITFREFEYKPRS